MLMMIGAVPVEVYPLNAHEYTRTDAARFAEKAVVGARPPLEAVGEGEGTLKVSCKLFPEKLGGLSYIDILRAQQSAQQGVPVMRGDGAPLGFMVITEISEKHERLDAAGVGRIVTVEISLKKADPPGPAALFAILAGLFG